MRYAGFTGISASACCHAFGLLQPLNMMHLCTMHAKIHTDHGAMTVEFFEKDAPNTVANFVKLAKEGFYEGLSSTGSSPDLSPKVVVLRASEAEGPAHD